MSYEYKVIPSPAKGIKGGDLKGAEGRFAHAVESAINALAASGWEYQRTDLLPSEERQGLTSSKTVYRSLMIFRRARHGGRTGIADDPAAGDSAPPPAPPAGDEAPRSALRASRSGDAPAPGVGFMDDASGDSGEERQAASRGPAVFLRGNTRP